MASNLRRFCNFGFNILRYVTCLNGSGFISKFRNGTNLVENQNNTETFIKLASVLSGLPNEIRIEGHTDSGAIIPGSQLERQFGNNWGLSAARAIVILEKLFENDQTGKLDRNKYSVAGYADTRPMASNDLPDGRALNRRVDIVIVRSDVTYYNQR